MYESLKNVPLFANLSQDDLESICGVIERVHLPAGEELFAEGDLGDRAYLIEVGELEILKVSGNRTVLLSVREAGEVIGELVKTSPSAAEAMYYTVLERWRNTESNYRQSEKMVQLGKLSAGLAHELNNPSAAVKRGAEQLEIAMGQVGETYTQLNGLELTTDQKEFADQLEKEAVAQASQPSLLDALARSDREYELEEWLEDQGVEDAWEMAPVLVDIAFSEEDLSRMVAELDGQQFQIVLKWLIATYTVYHLFAELKQGAERISGIVKALKTYSYLDQAPVQAVDINKGLDDTLLILSYKLKMGPSVVLSYDNELPIIQGYGSELNQVWTNIIDNAIDALAEQPPGEGIINIRTKHDGDWVIVDIEDNGDGIPEEIQPKLFDPFFTTKAPGAGTGLGLDISYGIVVHKHRGNIRVESEAGRTLFQVCLPLNFEDTTTISADAPG
jgi:signal transduction histidine kinase